MGTLVRSAWQGTVSMRCICPAWENRAWNLARRSPHGQQEVKDLRYIWDISDLPKGLGWEEEAEIMWPLSAIQSMSSSQPHLGPISPSSSLPPPAGSASSSAYSVCPHLDFVLISPCQPHLGLFLLTHYNQSTAEELCQMIRPRGGQEEAESSETFKSTSTSEYSDGLRNKET